MLNHDIAKQTAQPQLKGFIQQALLVQSELASFVSPTQHLCL